MVAETTPLFAQIAAQIEESVINGSLPEESRAPSTNELAAFHAINPATAAKGINQLVTKGVLEKRRGVGMFVTAGARQLLLSERRSAFASTYVTPLLAEARRLGMNREEVLAIIAEDSSGDPPLTAETILSAVPESTGRLSSGGAP